MPSAKHLRQLSTILKADIIGAGEASTPASEDYVRYTFRIPVDLYDRIRAAAGMASVNAEAISTLEEKYAIFATVESSLRDDIAGRAMAALIAADDSISFDRAADLAYGHADAMLAARAKAVRS